MIARGNAKLYWQTQPRFVQLGPGCKVNIFVSLFVFERKKCIPL